MITDVKNIESKQKNSSESQQKIHLPISAFENYVTVLRGRVTKARDETSLSQDQNDDEVLDTERVDVDRGEGKRRHTKYKPIPDNVFNDMIKNKEKQKQKKDDLQLKEDRLQRAEEQLQELKENNKEDNKPIEFFNLKKYLFKHLLVIMVFNLLIIVTTRYGKIGRKVHSYC